MQTAGVKADPALQIAQRSIANVIPRREAERAADLRNMLRLITSRLAAPLYIFFWAADWVYAPTLIWWLLALRLSVVIVSFLVNVIVRNISSLKKLELFALAFTFYCAQVLALMAVLTGGPTSEYYVGLNLACMGTLLFLPLSTRAAILGSFAVYGPYIAVATLQSFRVTGAATGLLIRMFFIGSTLFMSWVIRHFHEKLRLSEVAGRLRLETEIAERDEIIKKKTDESVRLAHLSAQFSPQVVQSIRRGNIHLDAGIHRSEICALFIDIVDSTERVTHIDNKDMNRVITMFMDDTMRVLLKYDITIDKFLGDGVLAFSNDPVHHRDYVERALRAALEIKQTVSQNSHLYEDYWLKPLQLRTGIAHGFCNIGFYGSENYYRTYTAIGPAVNLASRLCSSAAPGQILISRDVTRRISAEHFSFEFLGTKTLKGFGEDQIKIFLLHGESGAPNSPTEIVECPRCASVMHIDDSNGLFVLKCRRCDFVLESPKNSEAT